MTSIPDNFEIEIEKYPRALSNLLSFVFIPVFLIYTTIIYCYTGKILIEKALPSNTIGYLISIYGIISMLIYYCLYSAEEKTGIIYLYKKHFHKFLILPLVLLLYAIYLRINQYGFTISRYLILIWFIWLTISTSILFSKYKKNAPTFILKTLVILLLFSSLGPWGAVNLSVKTQLKILTSLLEKNRILIDGKIYKNQAEIDKIELCLINKTVEYIIFNGKQEKLAYLLSNNNQQSQEITAENILKALGLKKTQYINCEKIAK